MPTRIDKLRRRTNESAKFRGHKLYWEPVHGASDKWQTTRSAVCRHDGCFAYVVVRTYPMPNETEIGGTAVALNCPVKE